MSSRVAAIIPCYNSADTLPALIDALKAQTFTDFTAIFVDDGSTDESATIIRDVANDDLRFHLLAGTHNGPGAARNIGLDVADKLGAEYVTFIDSDDIPDESMLDLAVQALVQSKADIVHYQWRSRAGGEPHPDSIGKASIYVWNKIYRRAAIQGIRFVESKYAEDLAFFLETEARQPRRMAIDRPLYTHTIRAGSLWESRTAVDVAHAMRTVISHLDPIMTKADAKLSHRWKTFYRKKLEKNLRKSLKKEITLHYVNGDHNFGDDASPVLIEHLSQRPVRWASKYSCSMLGIGSILGWAYLKKCKGPFDRLCLWIRRWCLPKVTVFGSGLMMEPNPPTRFAPRRRAKFVAVRGRLTRDALVRLGVIKLPDSEKLALGDPGLLFSDLWPNVRRLPLATVRAYVPHKQEWGTEELERFMRDHPQIRIIDVRREPAEVFADLASCGEVFSSSLHGIIACDSLGVPNRWVRLRTPGRSFEDDRFKFDDYYSAFGVQREPCELAEVPYISIGEQVPSTAISQAKGILRTSFSDLILTGKGH